MIWFFMFSMLLVRLVSVVSVLIAHSSIVHLTHTRIFVCARHAHNSLVGLRKVGFLCLLLFKMMKNQFPSSNMSLCEIEHCTLV